MSCRNYETRITNFELNPHITNQKLQITNDASRQRQIIIYKIQITIIKIFELKLRIMN